MAMRLSAAKAGLMVENGSAEPIPLAASAFRMSRRFEFLVMASPPLLLEPLIPGSLSRRTGSVGQHQADLSGRQYLRRVRTASQPATVLGRGRADRNNAKAVPSLQRSAWKLPAIQFANP